MRSRFALTVVLVAQSDESWRSDEFVGTGSAPQSHGKQEVNGDEVGGRGGVFLLDGLTACTDIREEPESFGQCRI